MVKCILMYFNLFQDQIYLRTPKESAELRTTEVVGCVCLAEAEKDNMLQQNKQ